MGEIPVPTKGDVIWVSIEDEWYLSEVLDVTVHPDGSYDFDLGEPFLPDRTPPI